MNSAHPRNLRVLIVDDNRAIQDDFRKILEVPAEDVAFQEADRALFGSENSRIKSTPFVIDSAYQGAEAVEKVQRSLAAGTPYSVAFVDVRMPPGWDGIETTAKIWAIDPHVQVVICTAYSDYSWEEMSEKLNCADRLLILKKPFDTVEVLQLAHTLSAKWNSDREARLRLDELAKLVKQGTAELHRNHERLALISRASNDAIWDWEIAADELWWNEGFAVLFGYEDEGLERGLQRWSSRVHPDDVDRVLAGLRDAIDGSTQFWADGYRFRRKNGTYAFVDARGQVVRDENGQALRLVGALQDVSLRKQAEHERTMLEVQLRQSQKLESIGQLAAGVAHEINTPMQFIGDNARFIREAFGDLANVFAAYDQLLIGAKSGAIPAELISAADQARRAADLTYLLQELPKAADQAIEGVERVTKIVRAMKDFSHPGSDKKAMVDLNKSIESTLVVCRNEWKYVADVVTELDPRLPLVPVLPGEFNQVVLNIVINAAHAIAEKTAVGAAGKGTIRVSSTAVDNVVELRIQDTGAGIPAKIRDRIFDPFFTTKEVGKGTGQGLAIARSVVVDKHGGTLTFDSTPGEGTCFIIRLPLAEAA